MTKANFSDKECQETRYITPRLILNPVRRYYAGPIPLDPATEANNPTKAHRFFTASENGLEQPWLLPVFCNPPYGKGLADWCRKFFLESSRGQEIIALLPCGSGRPGTRYWQSCILQPTLEAICYIKGRVPFETIDGKPLKRNNYPSHLLGFNVETDRFDECFRHLGKVMRIAIREAA